MDLSKSAENTLVIYANACEYHDKDYHFRSLQQTLDVKKRVYLISRSLSTINRENRKFKDEKLITKWARRTRPNRNGRQFTSSITHLTWKGVLYLVRRKLMPWKFIRIWERISKKMPRFEPIVKTRKEKKAEKIESIEADKRLYRLSKLPLKILPYIAAGLFK